MDEFTSVLSEMQEHVGSLKSLCLWMPSMKRLLNMKLSLRMVQWFPNLKGGVLYLTLGTIESCKDNEEARKDDFVEMGRPASSAEGVVPPCATLVITLELVLWKTVTEVTDKKVIKKIIKEGEVKCIGKLQDGTVFLKKGRGDDELFEFKTDEQHVIDGLDRAVMSMKKGEERESWDMNTPEKIEATGKKKEEGNVAFIAGKYAKASQRYEKAGKFIEYNTNFSEDENKKSKVLKYFCKLPEGIGELSNLRHLEVEQTYSLNYYPRGGIERLRQLRTLSKFVVRDGSKGSVIGELGNLNFLKGSLYITGLRHVKNVNEAKQAGLQKKKNISKLALIFGEIEQNEDVSSEEYILRMEGVLENLEPHKESLEQLEIKYYVGFTLPPWMLSVEESVLSNIIDLKLYWCPNLKVLPALGKLQFLEKLSLANLSAVKHLGADLLRVGNGDSTSSSSSSVVLFPKLKKLRLSGLPEWEEEEHDVPTTTSDNTTIIIMPRLHDLKISNCPKLKVVPVYLFPPQLETLLLLGDVGVVSKSLMSYTQQQQPQISSNLFFSAFLPPPTVKPTHVTSRIDFFELPIP
ncbi:hypothetical protein IFM89_034883 [Coptis chinensis]|uniref:peptidylprolyl isomerase n=1 Tax=Coptis chinensis TaxID=261450 RepID=A0A835I4X9_9MAGN|nr:hypothetical protein IFM89_034883 [Coptis chinensis]